MRSSNTFWSWKTSITGMPFFPAKSTFRKPLQREWTRYCSPHPLPRQGGHHRTLELYYKMNLQVRTKDGDGQTMRTWNLHKSSRNTFHVTISHPPPRPCLDSSSPSTVLIHWPSMSRALVCAEHSACCYSNSAHSSKDPASCSCFSPLSALQTQALTLSTNWSWIAICKSVKLISILLCVKAPNSYQERKIPWKQNLSLHFRFSILSMWEIHKPYCLGHVGGLEK